MITKKISLAQQIEAENTIRIIQKDFNYNTTEFSIEYFIDKINNREINNNLKWNTSQQSYFIESLLLGLPVLNIVINNNYQNELKIIDGKQRLYTAINFINNLQLENIKVLSLLNGFKFKDLSLPRQKKFKRILIRTIILSSNFDTSI
jgi:uncharacterized protein with ParB-like and HNH nuclease domain